MSNPGRGGYGKRAPYETVHYRIPKPIKPAVEMLAERFRQLVGGGVSDPTGESLIKRVENAIVGDIHHSREGQNVIHQSRQSTRSAQDEDSELEEDLDADEYDDDSEPTHAEVEKAQAAINHKLLLEVKMLDREVAELKTKLQSADETIYHQQFTLEIAQAKLTTVATVLKDALSIDSRKGTYIKDKIKEALQLVDNA